MSEDKEKFMAALRRLAEDPQPIQIMSDRFDVWCVLAAVQLACRHPENKSAARKMAEQWARQVGANICANDPDLRMLFEMGWDENFDVE